MSMSETLMPFGVQGVVQFGLDGEARGRRGGGDGLDDHFVAGQRSAARGLNS